MLSRELYHKDLFLTSGAAANRLNCSRMRALSYPLLLFVLALPLQDRRLGRKPVLIRADDASSKEQEEVPPEPDPDKARKAVELGNFYYKRDNYTAAEIRYREAILYGPDWPEGYEKLVKTLETMAQYGQAIQICRDFLKAVPDSEKASEFERRAKLLEQKLDGGADGR